MGEYFSISPRRNAKIWEAYKKVVRADGTILAFPFETTPQCIINKCGFKIIGRENEGYLDGSPSYSLLIEVVDEQVFAMFLLKWT